MPARLPAEPPRRRSREESREITRERLIDAARQLFRSEGYAGTSLDRIAEQAGYSKGAVYSNFDGKDAIFLAALAMEGRLALDSLFQAMDRARTTQGVVNAVADWADQRSTSGSWALPILEYARQPAADRGALRRQEKIFRSSWLALGTRLRTRFPGLKLEAETLGALLHELAHAPVMAIVDRPTAGDLVRATLRPLLAEAG